MRKRILYYISILCFVSSLEKSLYPSAATDAYQVKKIFNELNNWISQSHLFSCAEENYVSGTYRKEDPLNFTIPRPLSDNQKITRTLYCINQTFTKDLKSLRDNMFKGELHFFTRQYIDALLKEIKKQNAPFIGITEFDDKKILEVVPKVKENYEKLYPQINILKNSFSLFSTPYNECKEIYFKESQNRISCYHYLLIWAYNNNLIEQMTVFSQLPSIENFDQKEKILLKKIKDNIMPKLQKLETVIVNKEKSTLQHIKAQLNTLPEHIDNKQTVDTIIALIKNIEAKRLSLEKLTFTVLNKLIENFIIWAKQHTLYKQSKSAIGLTDLFHTGEHTSFTLTLLSIQSNLTKQYNNLRSYDTGLIEQYDAIWQEKTSIHEHILPNEWEATVSKIKDAYKFYRTTYNKLKTLYVSWAVNNALLTESETRRVNLDTVIDSIRTAFYKKITLIPLQESDKKFLIDKIHTARSLSKLSALYAEIIQKDKEQRLTHVSLNTQNPIVVPAPISSEARPDTNIQSSEKDNNLSLNNTSELHTETQSETSIRQWIWNSFVRFINYLFFPYKEAPEELK